MSYDARLGRVTWSLLTDRSWVVRRLETVEFLDEVTIRRRVTLDIDTRRVASVAGTTSRQRVVTVPLAVLAKGLLVDLSLRAADGSALAVSTRSHDVDAAYSCVLEVIREDGVDPDTLSEPILRKIRCIVDRFPDADDADARDTANAWSVTGDVDLTSGEWLAFVSNLGAARVVLEAFTFDFLLMTELVLSPAGVTVVKYSIDESLQLAPSTDWIDNVKVRLAIKPKYMTVVADSLGNAQRDHLRVDPPPGAEIVDAYLGEVSDGLEPDVPRSTTTFMRRVTTRRAHMYVADADGGPYVAWVALRAPHAGFIRAAKLSTALSTLILAAFAFASPLFDPEWRKNADAAVALMLLAPSFLSVYLAQAGEHQLVSSILRVPRYAIALSAFANFCGCFLVVSGIFASGLEETFALLAFVSFLVWELLTLVGHRSNREVALVNDRAHATVELKLDSVLIYE